MRYFIYCRKSTESDDRQVLSIDSQRDELLRVHKGNSEVQIIEILEESKSAKAPGRPVFDSMINRIERGEAEGILCWHPDRLARNSVDGGRIIYLLDQGRLKDLKFSTFTFENNSQGKFMLQITFGYSKYYVDTLSENVKRGNRAKVERGWRPGPTPLGYRNERESRTIARDGKHFETMQRIFSLVLSEQYSVRAILRMATEDWGYRTPHYGNYTGAPLAQSTLYLLLANPYYAGYFHWNGELYQGKHEPMITLSEFERVQKFIGRQGVAKPHRHTFPFTGLIRCGACGLMVTAEHKTNRYGNRYIYYHCTKRGQPPRCDQPSVEAKELGRQMRSLLEQSFLSDEEVLGFADVVVRLRGSHPAFHGDQIEPLEEQRRSIERQLAALDSLRIREFISDADYIGRRRDLKIEEAACRERLAKVNVSTTSFEPALLLVSFRNQAKLWFDRGTDEVKRAIVTAIGSNFSLIDKKLLAEAEKPFTLRVEEPAFPYMSRFLDYVRTGIESNDPALLRVISKVRAVKAMVEAEERNSVTPRLALGGPDRRKYSMADDEESLLT